MAESCLKIKPLMNPYALLASCSACGKEVVRVEYDGYSDYKRKAAKYKGMIKSCPHCNAEYQAKQARKAPKWAKKGGDYIAECENGDFLVFKWGYAWKWRYRRYGRKEPDQIATSFSLETAKRACERHKEWK